MPVRKPAAKKTAAKSAAKPLAKKVAAAKTTKKTSAKSASKDSDESTFFKNIAAAIEDGKFDGGLIILDDALTARANKLNDEKKAAKKSTANKSGSDKKVGTAPKRTKSAAITPESGKSYKIVGSKLDGAKVKFIKLSIKDNTKAQIEMLVDKPGYPKGKRALIPVSALGNLK